MTILVKETNIPHLTSHLSVGVVLGEILQPLRRVTLGPFQRQSQRPVPVQLTQPPHGPANAEQYRVILVLGEAVVPKQHAAVRIDVRVRIRHLPVFLQHAGHHRVDGIYDLEERIVGHVLQSELALARVSRIGLAQHRVAITGHDLLRVQRLPREFGNRISVHLLPLLREFVLQRLYPLEYLLIRESVEGAGEGVQSRRVR